MSKKYLIHDKPFKALFILALPIIIGNMFQQFYTMVDSMVVGRMVGEDALAAVGASYALTTVFISIAIGGGIGASVLTSRYFGARQYADMKRTIRLSLFIFLALSILLGVVGILGSYNILIWLQTPRDILDMAVEYLNIYFYGLPFLFLYNVVAAMFNALGRSRIPLYLLIFSSVLNIGLDIYMVGPMNMGIAGAAWATLIAQGIAAATSFLLFLREMHSYDDTIVKGKSARELQKIAAIALPSILQQSTVSIGMMLVQSVVNGFGTQMISIGNAMSPFTAQNLGAGKHQRVRQGYRAGLLMVILFALFIGLLLEGLYNPIITLFLGSEGTGLARQVGTSYLQFMGFFYALLGLKMATDGVLRGAGDMKMFTIANLANLAIRVIIAITLAPRYGIQMVWYAVPIGWAINDILSFAQYKTGQWERIGKAKSSVAHVKTYESQNI